MKNRILIIITFLIGILLYSCSTSKKISENQTPPKQPKMPTVEKVESKVEKVVPVELPETKESIDEQMKTVSPSLVVIKDLEKRIADLKDEKNQAVRNQEYELAADKRDEESRLTRELELVKVEYEEEKESLEDNYGTEFNDYRNIPIYDINNMPISVWFIKSGRDYKGFIVAGHATKAVCEVASLEVHNKIKAIGKSESSIFSYGIGHNILSENESSSSYHEIMKTMKKEFEELEMENSDQVSVNEIDYDKYTKYLTLFEKHIDLANKTKEWDTHMVEYKLEDFPIIAPFYTVQNSEKIKISVPKELFGGIPTELVFASYSKSITDMENYLNEKINSNKNEINRIKKFKNSDEIIPIWDITYFELDGVGIVEKKEILFGYSPPPEGLSYVTKDQFGNIVSERPITFKEALRYLNNPEIVRNTSPILIRQLREWKVKAEEERSSFEQRKKDLSQKIKLENDNLNKFLVTIKNRKKELLNRDNNDYIIDAFLRGWVFETGSEKLNKDLDKWYSERRSIIWNYILDSVPNSRINGKLAGVFHSDDVFFQIESKANSFDITPYKVVGGEFIQVIDKSIGISYIQTPFNFRLTQK